jgi:hypothetical protein
MPKYDGTGPTGAGAGTGRGQGNCMRRAGVGALGGPGSRAMSPTGPRRVGFGGRCLGFLGWWRGFWGQSADPALEAEALRTNLSAAKQEIAAMEARLAKLEEKE